MNITFEATWDKGKPMPCICEICQAVDALPKKERNKEQPEANSCFEKNEFVTDYQPFTNTRRKVKKTCAHFSHMRRMSYR